VIKFVIYLVIIGALVYAGATVKLGNKTFFEHVRAICDESIRTAARDERKTVLERDVPRPPRR